MKSASTSSGEFDVVIVGSGATGGVAAMELTSFGLKTLVLEAGPKLDATQVVGRGGINQLKRVYRHLVSNPQPIQKMHPGYWECSPDLFVSDAENPYSHPADKPYHWIRGRHVGGRSLTWGGVTLRLSDYEFKPAQQDGEGVDWPIGHDDLAPYYAKLETYFQVHGSREALPQLPDGEFLPPSEMTPAELMLKASLAEHAPDRRMIICRGIGSSRTHRPSREQPWPMLSSPGTSLRTAMATGLCELRDNAVVRHVVCDPHTRLASGVEFVDRLTKQTHCVRAKYVVLCASTIETNRILLLSLREQQPGGLVDTSGLLGTHLTDHIATATNVLLPRVPQAQRPFELFGSDSVLIPRFRNLGKSDAPFLRGYGLWGGIQRFAPLPDFLRKGEPGATGFLAGHGEVIARAENRVTLHPSRVDACGIPIPHIEFAWSTNEKLMVADMQQQIRDLIAMAGGHCLDMADIYRVPPPFGAHIARMEQLMTCSTPGLYVHELGGARMGTTEENSVVGPHNQWWSCPNLLVTDGACWPTSGWQNPTLTEMAITARACHYLATQLR
ncbi:glucose-methanol-choline oxidoreductase [Pirellula staleyi DSM 6068]|uniref:Glucose-methanol-choline oxidoreductase n=1 Tax=Pirellula staleyi (strain ATCC 27377 / DSM 6068 / ICPB 4128) TaxID=530564 RepID=D2R7G4_PIRSD|nr:GMC family oxidoreductase [Pirellula staleyi]ADB15660.1 glucose-methanol-choline oxidoreductase [Pirellula staleyi DSM 6068]